MPDSSPEDAWSAGEAAGRARQALLSNPFPAGTEAHRQWQAG